MREECERPSTARSTGEEGGSVSSAAGHFTSAAARPAEEGAPQTEAREYRAHYSPRGIRQERSAWPNLEALPEGAESGPDEPDFFANISEETRADASRASETLCGVLVPSARAGLSAVLEDLAERAHSDAIRDYAAITAAYRTEVRRGS